MNRVSFLFFPDHMVNLMRTLLDGGRKIDCNNNESR
jgi:hypothetical protein